MDFNQFLQKLELHSMGHFSNILYLMSYFTKLLMVPKGLSITKVGTLSPK